MFSHIYKNFYLFCWKGCFSLLFKCNYRCSRACNEEIFPVTTFICGRGWMCPSQLQCVWWAFNKIQFRTLSSSSRHTRKQLLRICFGLSHTNFSRDSLLPRCYLQIVPQLFGKIGFSSSFLTRMMKNLFWAFQFSPRSIPQNSEAIPCIPPHNSSRKGTTFQSIHEFIEQLHHPNI